MSAPIEIDADIRVAATLPGRAYSDPRLFAIARERVFAPSWQLVGDGGAVSAPGSVCPVTLLPGLLDEPVALASDAAGALHALSNVCTHRASLVVREAGAARELRCPYHGRRFGLDGRFLSMPEFDGALGFPSPRDDLPRLALGRWQALLFASLAPEAPFEALIAELAARVGWLPLAGAPEDPSRARAYEVNANWALYVDNYLEGFHIPFVHPGLAGALDYARYRTELWPHGVLQVGLAREGADGEDALAPPPGHPDHGQRVAAYYVWLWPNTMLNFYPWGLSINVVEPLAVDRTRIRYQAYVWDASRAGRGAGGDLDKVEHEDDAIVESVQRGVRSRLYDRGRYSPERERGVHHFHRRLAQALREQG